MQSPQPVAKGDKHIKAEKKKATPKKEPTNTAAVAVASQEQDIETKGKVELSGRYI
jgi:hypothetical protein